MRTALRRLATAAAAAGLAAAGFAAAGSGVTASPNDTTGTTTTTTTPHRHHRHVQQVAPVPSARTFPRWAIGGFALAGVLIVSGLAGFVFTRTRP
jgi:hypothetical protein